MKILKMLISIILIIVIIVFVLMIFKNLKTPSGLGVKSGKFAPVPTSPNAVSTQTEDIEKKVEPLEFKGSIIESKKKIKEAMDQYGGYIIKEESEYYMHMVFTTGKMKFNDDVELYFDNEKKIIHYRSASRVGYSDMGLNKERYEKIVNLYNK